MYVLGVKAAETLEVHNGAKNALNCRKAAKRWIIWESLMWRPPWTGDVQSYPSISVAILTVRCIALSRIFIAWLKYTHPTKVSRHPDRPVLSRTAPGVSLAGKEGF